MRTPSAHGPTRKPEGGGKSPSEKSQGLKGIKNAFYENRPASENQRGYQETTSGLRPSKSTAGCSNRPGGASNHGDLPTGEAAESADKGPAKRPDALITADNGGGELPEVAVLPPGELTLADVRNALDRALVDGDVHLARRLNRLAADIEAGRIVPGNGARRGGR